MPSRAIRLQTCVSYKKADDRTMDLTVKKAGRVIGTGRIAVAADGKSRTVTTSGMNAKGKKFKSVAVYDKQEAPRPQ